MYIKNISLENQTIVFFGGVYSPNDYVDISDVDYDQELYLEVEDLINADKFRVSLDKEYIFSKDESLKYMKNYTRDKKQYRIYENVFGHTRGKNLGDIDYETELSKSLFFDYQYKFGRKLRKTGYWYENGTHDSTKPVIRIDYNYSFDIAGLIQHVEKRISYYKKDSSLDLDVKISTDVYNYLRKGQEQIKRRERIYTEITGLVQNSLIGSGQYTAADIIIITTGFVSAIYAMIRAYIDNGIYLLVDLLRDNTVAGLETQLNLSDLAFLDFDYGGSPLKSVFVSLLDYRTPEDASIAANGGMNEGLAPFYNGSSL